MHCFWAGEVELGIEEGIVYTEPGYIENFEAMIIKYDTSKMSYRELLETSRSLNLVYQAFAHSEDQTVAAREVIGEENVEDIEAVKFHRVDDNAHIKYYLGKTLFRHVPMTERQKIMVNSALFFEEDPTEYLSPRQLEMYEYIRKKRLRTWKNLVPSLDFVQDWQATTGKIREMSKGEISIH
jgi:hypothetical protein